MLINFSLTNWKSFQKNTEFSMVARDYMDHNDRLPVVSNPKLRLLPVGVIFGGNASGKSNFIEALKFCKWLILTGPKREGHLPIESFKLDSDSMTKATKFNFELLIDEKIYSYKFSLKENYVVQEKLSILTNELEKPLYIRRFNKIKFFNSLKKNKLLELASTGIRKNQLFLTYIYEVDSGESWPVFNWFENSLAIVTPDSAPRFELIDYNSESINAINSVIEKLDCGIAKINPEDITDKISPSKLSQLSKLITLGARIVENQTLISQRDGKIHAGQLVTFHPAKNGKLIEFSLDEESDGTIRVLDLLPGIFDISKTSSQKVYIIDEIDRSLHSLMSQDLLQAFLNHCSTDSRSQMIFTTHDLFLMDQKFLRKDEMWLTDRDNDGNTSLISVDDFKIDKSNSKLYKDYLRGRFGGIPEVLFSYQNQFNKESS